MPPERLYQTYTGRGQCENHIKELKCAMLGDRMSEEHILCDSKHGRCFARQT